jgi:hypothetical protein
MYVHDLLPFLVYPFPFKELEKGVEPLEVISIKLDSLLI